MFMRRRGIFKLIYSMLVRSYGHVYSSGLVAFVGFLDIDQIEIVDDWEVLDLNCGPAGLRCSWLVHVIPSNDQEYLQSK